MEENMSKAFKCDICHKYFDGSHEFEIKITNRFVDMRDGEVTRTLTVCSKCGGELWDARTEK